MKRHLYRESKMVSQRIPRFLSHLPFTICHFTFAMLFAVLLTSTANAIQVTGQTLSNFNITAETVGTATGTYVQFTLSDPADVTVFITPSGSTTSVKTLTQNYSSSGSQSLYWDGLWTIGDDTGRRNGNYTVTVLASSGTSTSFVDVAQPLRINSVDIHNLTVTPSFDANNNASFPFTIQYQLAKESYVTMLVANSSGTVVRTLLNNKLQVGEGIANTTVLWDGLDDNNRAVPIGFYRVALVASNPTSNDLSIPRVRSFVVQSLAGSAENAQKVFEDGAYVYPNPVRNGRAYFRAVPVRDSAHIRLKIYTMAGDLVMDRDITSTIPYSWDVTNQAGNKLGRGLYFYVLREEDSQGTLQTIKKMAVIP